MGPTDAIDASSEHVEHNRRWWNERSDGYQHRHADQLPARTATWGVFATVERELGALGEVAGRDVVELGSGAAQFSIALAREGARCTAVDFSSTQLDNARRLLDEIAAEDGARPDVTLVEALVEQTGLPTASFDIAFSDYGASMFADPRLWLAEAARLLRPGGRLAFSGVSPVLDMCWKSGQPVSDTLDGDYFSLGRFDADGTTMYNLPYGEWIRVLRESGFDVVDLVETRPHPDVESTSYRSASLVEWARRSPAEMIWVADRR